MTLINPPDCDDEPEPEPVPVKNCSWEEHRRIQLFLNVNPWRCKCGLTLHGRVLNCVRCNQPRPENYKK